MKGGREEAKKCQVVRLLPKDQGTTPLLRAAVGRVASGQGTWRKKKMSGSGTIGSQQLANHEASWPGDTEIAENFSCVID